MNDVKDAIKRVCQKRYARSILCGSTNIDSKQKIVQYLKHLKKVWEKSDEMQDFITDLIKSCVENNRIVF